MIDLVLFSEMALTSLTFSFETMSHFLMKLPEVGWNSISLSSSSSSTFYPPPPPQEVILRRLSFLAYSANIYLVANWGDKPNSTHQYNTELVFSPMGHSLQSTTRFIHSMRPNSLDHQIRALQPTLNLFPKRINNNNNESKWVSLFASIWPIVTL